MSFPALRLQIVGPDGAYGRPLTEVSTIDLTCTDGEPNSIAFTYDARHESADLLDHIVTVALLVGGVEYPDMRFVLDDSGRDEVLEEETVAWSALSVLGQLAYGVVLPDLGLGDTGGVALGLTTPGKALRTLIERCQARGVLTWVQLGFTDNLDSSGATWAPLAGEYVEAGKTILDVVTTWNSRRTATARMDGTTLRLYAYGNQGADRSQVADGMLLRGRDLLDGPWNSSTRDARSIMWAYGELPNSDPDTQPGGGEQRGDETGTTSGGIPLLLSETNQSAFDRFGPREGWLSQQQVESESQLRAIASGSLALTNRARDAYAYKLALGDGPLPLINWGKGDVLQVRVNGRDRQMRVRALTINQDASGEVTGSAAFGDRMMDADEELARSLERLQQLTGQSMDGGLYNAPIVTYDKLTDSAAVDTVRVKKSELTQAQWDQLLQLGFRGIYGDDDQPTDPSIYVPRGVLVAVKAGADVSSTGGGIELVRVVRSSVTGTVWARLLELGYTPVAMNQVDEDGDGEPDAPLPEDPDAVVYVPRDVLTAATNGADLVSIDTSEKWLRIVKAATPVEMWDKFLELGYRPITVAAGTAYDVLYIPKSIYAQVAAGTGLSSDYDEAGDFTPPQPPSNLTATSFALTDGLYLGSSTIRLSWTASTSTDVAWYELAYQDLEFAQDQVSGFWREIPQTTQTVASIERLRPGYLYRFRLRAVDGAYNVSAWQSLDVRAAVDTVAPTQRPTAPIVTTSMYNTIRVEWDGKAEGGVAFNPDDVRTVEVHRSTASGYTPTAGTLITTMTVVGRNTASTLIYGSVGDTHYVRLVPVDVAGNVGNRAATCSAQATGATADVFASGLPDRSVNPETIAWNDLDNMVPDGSFERDGYRADALAGLFSTSPDAGTWTPGKATGTTFTDVGLATPPVVSTYPAGAWSGAPAPTVVGDAARKTGSLHALWTTTGGPGPRAFDAGTMYRLEVRFKVQVDSVAVSGLTPVYMGFGARRYDSASGTYKARAYDGSESDGITNDVLLRQSNLSSTGGEFTSVIWIRGTSSTAPTGGAGLSFDTPAAMPNGATHLAISIRIGSGTDGAQSVVDVLSAEIRNVASPAFDGRWVLDLAAPPSAGTYQRLDLLKTRPSKGGDVFYAVGRAKLVGSRTNQPGLALIASWRDDSDREIFAAAVSKSGGFTHDGWFQFEGRLTLGVNRPDLRSGQIDSVTIYLVAWNITSGQTLRVDGIELRRAQTNVLIADLAVDDAKIANASVSKLTAGTMNAEMVVGRAIRTPTVANGVSTVGLYGRAGGGKGYAYFGALDEAGITTVEINGETGSAKFGGTITAAELSGAIKVRYPTGTGYLELTTTSYTPQGLLPGLQTVFPSDSFVRTPSTLALAGSVVSMSPSKFHLTGAGANDLTFSSLQHQVVITRNPTSTPAADVDAVLGRTVIDHPYCQFLLTDQSYRGTLGRYPVMWIRSGAFIGAAGIGIDHFNTSNWGDVYVDVLKTQDPYSGTNVSYAQMRGISFTNQSFTSGKRDIREFDLGATYPARFSALELLRSNPSQVYRRRDQSDEQWFVGPMADRMPPWLTRAGGFGAHDLAGILWRAIEELTEIVDGNRRTIASLVGRSKEVLPASATKEMVNVELAKQLKPIRLLLGIKT
ncbi:fibronectin type III domain-containing protein [Actinomycetospora termitidis]|uniref:Fibronectin type III domain-containing protein n=1 Tax=Actinomycetospora termitidis TaxID=3053470 RepID=A0ABT7MFF1_9PSEU|nr:fibronectin type III domain-containing protein [Actinomycetospora sp. Odt1-22]MDL5159397.1 fibronectin type III domain-containing protein [Actinomycetospora sp. Odt1-22]